MHPPVGKWVIASGEQVFESHPSVGASRWRFLESSAFWRWRVLSGDLRGPTSSAPWPASSFAIDGLAIVMSRTALLDNSLMFFVILAFGALLLDRDRTRARLAKFGETTSVLGPALWWRPWRLVAGVCLGLACGVKWSGLYFVVAFGLLTVLWDVGSRRTIGVRMPFRAMIVRDAIPAFLSIVGVAVVVYVATWTGWFLSSDGWDRTLGGGRHVIVQLDTRAVAQPLALPRRSLEFPYRT